MFLKYLRHRVFIDHSHGRLHIRILHGHRKDLAIFGVLLSSLFVVLTGSMFIAPVRRAGWSMDLIYLLPLILLAVAYYIVLRIAIWVAYGLEEIVVEGGHLRWTCIALWLRDELRAAASEVTEVKAVTPWHGRNFVELTTRGRTYRIGDPMLRDEAIQLAHAMKAAIGLR